MSLRIVRPSSPLGYHKVVADLVALLPWQNEGVDLELVPHVLAQKADPKDMAKQTDFLKAWRLYCENDLFFLARYTLSTGSHVHKKFGNQLDRPWLYRPNRYYLFEYIRELEDRYRSIGKDGRPLLHRVWINRFRRGYKSTSMMWLVNYALVRHQSLAVSYYSKRKAPQATDRASMIRLEWETNALYHRLYPHLFWASEHAGNADYLRQVTRQVARENGVEWSADRFTLCRQGSAETRPDPTVQCNGILSGLYTGGGADIRIFDDIVDRENTIGDLAATTVANTRDALKIVNPHYHPLDLFVGTNWPPSSPYQELKRQKMIRREWKCSAVDETMPDAELQDIGGAKPIFLTVEELREQRGVGEAARIDFVCQYLCKAEDALRRPLDPMLIGTYRQHPRRVAAGCPIVILMDPGGSGTALSPQHKLSDTAIGVVALRPDGMKMLVDLVVDILTPSERAEKITELWRTWTTSGGHVTQVRFENPGQTDDGAAIAAQQEQAQVYFDVIAVARGATKVAGGVGKIERAYQQLEPIMAARQLMFPAAINGWRRQRPENLVQYAREAIRSFGSVPRTDVVDMLALLGEPVGRPVWV